MTLKLHNSIPKDLYTKQLWGCISFSPLQTIQQQNYIYFQDATLKKLKKFHLQSFVIPEGGSSQN